MKKRGMSAFGVVLIILIFVLAGLIVMGIVLYSSSKEKDYTEIYSERNASGNFVNPAASLTNEEAIAAFDESFVYYLLVNIKAYNLHEPLASSDTPKIELYIGEDIFNAEVKDGEIDVNGGEIEGEDIIIRTSKEEAVEMTREKNYIKSSFENGKSSIELVSGKTELFSKGYLKLYTELTGKSFTGSAIKRFFS
ncbi:hypothetical protein J4402_00475 [Candidatus Pacearchaeota archaeon]|nr:hypothetical protein [Candidatus Pacearchaeota archaeon]